MDRFVQGGPWGRVEEGGAALQHKVHSALEGVGLRGRRGAVREVQVEGVELLLPGVTVTVAAQVLDLL